MYDRAARTSRLQSVEFASVYNHECDWVATCLNPKFRLEVEGVDLPVCYLKNSLFLYTGS